MPGRGKPVDRKLMARQKKRLAVAAMGERYDSENAKATHKRLLGLSAQAETLRQTNKLFESKAFAQQLNDELTRIRTFYANLPEIEITESMPDQVIRFLLIKDAPETAIQQCVEQLTAHLKARQSTREKLQLPDDVAEKFGLGLAMANASITLARTGQLDTTAKLDPTNPEKTEATTKELEEWQQRWQDCLTTQLLLELHFFQLETPGEAIKRQVYLEAIAGTIKTYARDKLGKKSGEKKQQLNGLSTYLEALLQDPEHDKDGTALDKCLKDLSLKDTWGRQKKKIKSLCDTLRSRANRSDLVSLQTAVANVHDTTNGEFQTMLSLLSAKNFSFDGETPSTPDQLYSGPSDVTEKTNQLIAAIEKAKDQTEDQKDPDRALGHAISNAINYLTEHAKMEKSTAELMQQLILGRVAQEHRSEAKNRECELFMEATLGQLQTAAMQGNACKAIPEAVYRDLLVANLNASPLEAMAQEAAEKFTYQPPRPEGQDENTPPPPVVANPHTLPNAADRKEELEQITKFERGVTELLYQQVHIAQKIYEEETKKAGSFFSRSGGDKGKKRATDLCDALKELVDGENKEIDGKKGYAAANDIMAKFFSKNPPAGDHSFATYLMAVLCSERFGAYHHLYDTAEALPEDDLQAITELNARLKTAQDSTKEVFYRSIKIPLSTTDHRSSQLQLQVQASMDALYCKPETPAETRAREARENGESAAEAVETFGLGNAAAKTAVSACASAVSRAGAFLRTLTDEEDARTHYSTTELADNGDLFNAIMAKATRRPNLASWRATETRRKCGENMAKGFKHQTTSSTARPGRPG